MQTKALILSQSFMDFRKEEKSVKMVKIESGIMNWAVLLSPAYLIFIWPIRPTLSSFE